MSLKHAQKFAELTQLARKRVAEERARQEDESAANVNLARARRLYDLQPAYSIVVDTHRRVRARDYFNMHLEHSTGVLIKCQVELVLRDDGVRARDSGEILICGTDDQNIESRYLMFQPVLISNVMAKPGPDLGNLVLRVSGVFSDGMAWAETLDLTSGNPQVCQDWLGMVHTAAEATTGLDGKAIPNFDRDLPPSPDPPPPPPHQEKSRHQHSERPDVDDSASVQSGESAIIKLSPITNKYKMLPATSLNQ